MAEWERLQQDVKSVKEGLAVLKQVLNPPWIEERAEEVFPGNSETRRLLEGFVKLDWIYRNVGPDKLPQYMWESAAAMLGQPVTVDLRVYVLIPKSLLQKTNSMRVSPALHWSGGGGVTGSPLFEDWIYQSDLQLCKEMISIHGAYRHLPESDSKDLASDRLALLTWLFQNLENEIQKVKHNLSIDWEKSYMFGGSFGGLMALNTWLEQDKLSAKPAEFCWRQILLRYPITIEYRRTIEDFMGVQMDLMDAEKESDRMWRALYGMPWIPPRAESIPPHSMIGAPYLAGHGRFHEAFKGPFPFEIIQHTNECPDVRTEFIIRHGTADQHVNVEDSKQTVNLLREKWPDLKVTLILQPGKRHGWDYFEPLSQDKDGA